MRRPPIRPATWPRASGHGSYVEYATGETELYDLVEDPDELTSLHADPDHSPVVQALQGYLEQFRGCHGQQGEDSCVVFAPEVPEPT